jgi:hypothetical protein
MLLNFSLASLDKSDFNYDANFLGTIYTYLLRDFKFIKFKKINVIVTDNKDISIAIRGENTDICNVYVRFNFEEYFEIEISKRPIKLIEIIESALGHLSSQLGWDNSVFKKIAQDIVDANFQAKILLIEKTNKQNQLTAKFYVISKMHGNDFYVSFYEKNKEVYSQLFYEGMSGFLYWEQLFYDFYWDNKYNFCIEDELKELKFIFSIKDSNFKIISLIESEDRKNKKLKLWAHTTDRLERIRLHQELF